MQWLAVAASLLVAACGSSRLETSRATSTTTTTTTATTTTVPDAGRYHRPGEQRELGRGEVVGTSADGTAAYVAAENPASKVLGCEGLPVPWLFSVPLDGTRRAPFAPAGIQPVAGEVVRSPRARTVAVVEQCEEFFTRLVLATEGPGGKLSEARALDEKVFSGLRPSLAWSRDGRTFLATTADERGDVVRLDPATGDRTTLLGGRRGLRAAEMADGSLVVLLPGELLVGRASIKVNGYGFALTPGGDQLAVHGEDGLFLVQGGGSISRLAPGPVARATWSPDGRAIAYLAGGEVRVVTLDGRTTTVSARAGFSAPFFAADGRAPVFSTARTTGAGIEEPFVAVVRFA